MKLAVYQGTDASIKPIDPERDDSWGNWAHVKFQWEKDRNKALQRIAAEQIIPYGMYVAHRAHYIYCATMGLCDKLVEQLSVNPWQPITDKRELKILGKLGEEVNECGTALFRCIIQGVDESEPETGKVNREWLQDEIADVLGNIDLVIEHFQLDLQVIRKRAELKKTRQRIWHGQL